MGEGGIWIWCHFGSIVDTQLYQFYLLHAVSVLPTHFLGTMRKRMGGQRATVTGPIGSPQASISEVLTQSILECVLILRWGRYSGKEVRVSPFR